MWSAVQGVSQVTKGQAHKAPLLGCGKRDKVSVEWQGSRGPRYERDTGRNQLERTGKRHVLALMHLVGKSALHHIGQLGRVTHAFSPNAWEAEAGISPSLRLDWSTE